MKENWLLMGDIHGSPDPIQYFYEENKERLDLDHAQNYLILLGDVGANYALKGERDARFKRELMKYPFTYICLRGNHEARVLTAMQLHPKNWSVQKKYGGRICVETQYPRIEYLEDGPAVYNFSGYRTLSIPGAYSVDKFYRLIRGWAWFEDEQLSEEEMDYARKLKQEGGPYDLVISHTCPKHVEPTDLFIPGLDQSTVDKTMENFLSELEFGLAYRRWAWGHFHADRLYPWKDGKEMLMLFHQNVIDLHKFMNMKKEDSLQDLLA